MKRIKGIKDNPITKFYYFYNDETYYRDILPYYISYINYILICGPIKIQIRARNHFYYE